VLRSGSPSEQPGTTKLGTKMIINPQVVILKEK
jgi:hypothetical protein